MSLFSEKRGQADAGRMTRLFRWMNGGFTASNLISVYIIATFLIHLIDAITGFKQTSFRVSVYLILTIVAWINLFKDQETGVINVADIKTPLILSSIAIFAPYLGGLIPFLGSSQAFQTAIVFFPAWVLYLSFAMGQNWFITICRWILVLLIIFLVFPIMVSSLINDFRMEDIETGINFQQTVSNTMRDLGYAVNNFMGSIAEVWNNAYHNLMRLILGSFYKDFFPGEVDKYENEKIGVYLEDLKAADPMFYEGEETTVWAVLKAKTLNDNIKIMVSCYSEEDGKKEVGDITPKEEFDIATEEEQYIDCTFERLNPGKRDVTFNAEFNFETMAYINTYFMDKEKLRAFTREGIDALDYYKIYDRNPIAVYTNGPVGVGIKTAEPLPIGIYSDEDNIPFFFAITIEKRPEWEGTIKEVTYLEVQVPESLELTNCDYDFEFKDNEKGYNIYTFNQDKETKKKWWENIAEYSTIMCRLNPTDPRGLLGNEPITTKYFGVTAKYVYELEKSVPVEVEEVKEYKKPEEAITSDEEEQEFKDKLNERVDGKTNKDIACEKIKECSDYDLNHYDNLGFNYQVWCDADPCNLNCYSHFKEEKSEVYYTSCMECNPYDPSLGMVIEKDSFCELYKTREYCEKDPCGGEVECKWENNKCVEKKLEDYEEEEEEEWKELPEEELESKIRAAASQKGVDPDIAVAIAKYEHRGPIKHYNEDGSVEISECNAVGVMQVLMNKNDYCSECSMSKTDLEDINNNIECGIRILKSKYDMVCYSSVTPIIRVSGNSAYKEKVMFNCKIDEYVDKYLEYDGNCDKMAIRAYNGLGCDGDGRWVDGKFINTADEEYVEGVMGYLNK